MFYYIIEIYVGDSKNINSLALTNGLRVIVDNASALSSENRG